MSNAPISEDSALDTTHRLVTANPEALGQAYADQSLLDVEELSFEAAAAQMRSLSRTKNQLPTKPATDTTSAGGNIARRALIGETSESHFVAEDAIADFVQTVGSPRINKPSTQPIFSAFPFVNPDVPEVAREVDPISSVREEQPSPVTTYLKGNSPMPMARLTPNKISRTLRRSSAPNVIENTDGMKSATKSAHQAPTVMRTATTENTQPTIAPAQLSSSPTSAQATSPPTRPTDVHVLAAQVYPLIKRLLAIERERLKGM